MSKERGSLDETSTAKGGGDGKRELEDPVRSGLEWLVAAAKEIDSGARRLARELEPPLHRLQRYLQENGPQIVEVMRAIATGVAAWPEQQRRIATTLAEHGWFVHGETPHVISHEAEAEINAGRVGAADRLLCEHCDEALGEFTDRMESRNPSRAAIIRKAVEAHTAGDFELSVPILLIQADGIAKDIVGMGVYEKKADGRPAVGDQLELPRGSELLEAVVAPLIDGNVVTKGGRKKPEHPPVLNRNQILHGEALDYGTHKLSCQAISLVSYVSWSLSMVVDRKSSVARE